MKTKERQNRSVKTGRAPSTEKAARPRSVQALNFSFYLEAARLLLLARPCRVKNGRQADLARLLPLLSRLVPVAGGRSRPVLDRSD